MSKALKILQEARERTIQQIVALKADLKKMGSELAEINSAIAKLADDGGNSLLDSAGSTGIGNDDYVPSDHGNNKLKHKIIYILNASDDGYGTQDIYNKLISSGVKTAKTSIATTLTRMKKERLVSNINGKWTGIKNESPAQAELSKELAEMLQHQS